MCLCEGILPAWHVFVWRYCTSVTCVCVKVLYKCDMCLCEGIVLAWHVFVWRYCTRVTCVCVKVLYQSDMCLCEGIVPEWHMFVWRYCTSVTCVCVKVLYQSDMCLCEGTVPANGEVDISVVFCPTSFQTASAKLQLTISQYLARPLVCTVLGQSAPGVCRSLQCRINISQSALMLVCVIELYWSKFYLVFRHSQIDGHLATLWTVTLCWSFTAVCCVICSTWSRVH